jgi:hypothetical protein
MLFSGKVDLQLRDLLDVEVLVNGSPLTGAFG